jgi:hypothetical protein
MMNVYLRIIIIEWVKIELCRFPYVFLQAVEALYSGMADQNSGAEDI